LKLKFNSCLVFEFWCLTFNKKLNKILFVEKSFFKKKKQNQNQVIFLISEIKHTSCTNIFENSISNLYHYKFSAIILHFDSTTRHWWTNYEVHCREVAHTVANRQRVNLCGAGQSHRVVISRAI